MKKLLVLCIALFSAAFVYSQQSSASSSVVQFLMPKTAYIGDRCELKYVFHTDADLFGEKGSGNKSSSIELETQIPVFISEADKCLVQSVLLEHTSYEYTLTIKFIPWKSGLLDFGAFDLAGLVRLSQKKDGAGSVFLIDINPVTINSIVEKTGITSLRPAMGPMVVPGTTYILIILGILFLICSFALGYLVLKLPVMIAFYISTKQQRYIKRQTKKTIRQMSRLLKQKLNDNDFCQKLSDLLRGYLAFRFDQDFMILTTGRLYSKFESLACGQISTSKEAAISNVIEVFQRCDYIRFAKGSLDSKREPAVLYETVLAEGERGLLFNRCCDALKIFMNDGEEQ